MKSSNKSITSLRNWLTSDRGICWVIFTFSLFIFLINIGSSLISNGPGYPLDDSWIHQTYARNIARNGDWSYSLNSQSAGSTSPLWTLLLVPGFFIGKGNPYIWTFLISWLSYFALILTCVKLFTILLPENKPEKIILALAMAFEWHLVWAAGSGMETIIFTLGIVWIFLLLRNNKYFLWIGFFSGLLVGLRPDGLTLLGPVLFVVIGNILTQKNKWKDLFWVVVGLCVPLLVYGLHNYSLSGQILPNTYFAKTAEYSELLINPLANRFITLFTVLLSGAGILLLPGFIFTIYRTVKNRDLWGMSGILWVIGFVLLYAMRMPVTYQHGRYLIPAIPMYFILGFTGTMSIIHLIKQQKQRFYQIVIYGSVLFTGMAFLFFGIKSYSTDVRIINELMVRPALWLLEETDADSIIAAHDIGAIGFFSERKIVDLAGLIDSSVAPFLRDEPRLKEYIEQSEADYLVVFSDWYNDLGKMGDLEKAFTFQYDEMDESVEIRRLQ